MILLISGSIFFLLKEISGNQNPHQDPLTSREDSIYKENTVYNSDNLILERLSEHTYLHTSFLNTNDFGRVACNGMIAVNENEAIVFDTPADNAGSEELIKFVTENLGCKIIAVIPTHFHEDCVGGLEKFFEKNIQACASNNTIQLLKNTDKNFTTPITGFDDSLALNIGDQIVYAQYFGEGHTSDNIIGFFPQDNAVFGGCLIKEVNANKGYLGDANINAWPETVSKIRKKFPQAEIVIPGHGKTGGKELFDYTITLFEIMK
ncbi:MAG TPA: subclass B1 metallo-beta-lactamase [Ignavibacteria bacterium]|nr:subclass B1 metallo-beta-lactamase [Ignavibacteria bacterium]